MLLLVGLDFKPDDLLKQETHEVDEPLEVRLLLIMLLFSALLPGVCIVYEIMRECLINYAAPLREAGVGNNVHGFL